MVTLPAELALKIWRNFTSEQIAHFAEPFSREREGTDGYGRKILENERRGYRWDYYERRVVTGERKKGQWYLDFIDGTEEGKELKEDNAKRNTLANAYRKAVQIIRQSNEINDRLGNHFSEDGKLIRVGIAIVELVYKNALDASKGVAKTHRPIRIRAICQEGFVSERLALRAGDMMGACTDLTVTRFLALDVDKGTTYLKLIDSKRTK